MASLNGYLRGLIEKKFRMFFYRIFRYVIKKMRELKPDQDFNTPIFEKVYIAKTRLFT